MIRQWISDSLYIGSLRVGAARPEATPDGGGFVAFCHLPGAPSRIGTRPDLASARKAVEQAAARSILNMFGHSPREIAAALEVGPDLRNAARALYTVAHWSPDRDVNAQAHWEALRAALGIEESRAATPNPDAPQIKLLTAAKALRAAQRAYMDKRGDDQLGAAVTDAATALDHAIATIDRINAPETEMEFIE